MIYACNSHEVRRVFSPFACVTHSFLPLPGDMKGLPTHHISAFYVVLQFKVPSVALFRYGPDVHTDIPCCALSATLSPCPARCLAWAEDFCSACGGATARSAAQRTLAVAFAMRRVQCTLRSAARAARPKNRGLANGRCRNSTRAGENAAATRTKTTAFSCIDPEFRIRAPASEALQ
jgi:hypothetical protein